MLIVQLKNYLSTMRDDANVLIYVGKTGEARQLLDSDLDITSFGHLVIDAEYEVPARQTTIVRERPQQDKEQACE